MAHVHIEVNGIPLCDWRSEGDGLALMLGMRERNIRTLASISCSNTDEEMAARDAAYLRDIGVQAVVVDGGCPSYGASYAED